MVLFFVVDLIVLLWGSLLIFNFFVFLLLLVDWFVFFFFCSLFFNVSVVFLIEFVVFCWEVRGVKVILVMM